MVGLQRCQPYGLSRFNPSRLGGAIQCPSLQYVSNLCVLAVQITVGRKHTLSRLWVEHPIARSHCRPYSSDMSTLLIIVVLLVLFGGGGGYYYTRRR
jgi:hypothetical protein